MGPLQLLGKPPARSVAPSGDSLSLWTSGKGWRPVDAADPVDDLRTRLTRADPRPDPRLPRFWGGAVGYFGYDLVRRIERLGAGPPDDQGLPEALFMFSDVVVAVDNLYGRAMAITTIETGSDPSPASLRQRYGEAVDKLARTIARLRSSAVPAPLDLAPAPGPEPAFTSNFEPRAFKDAVRCVKDYIAAGDAFQVVLSQRLTTRFEEDAFQLYRAIRTINPSPYLFNLDLGDFQIVGSSPEVLVRLEDGVVTVRPIAGTRRRGRTPAEDRALAEELAADEKELAEHRMLVDLGRNDVGRVSEYGTVTVPELMKVERYSHVMHLCSQVEGRARGGCRRWTFSAPVSPPERFPARPRSAPWRSSTNLSPRPGGLTPARSGTSGGAAPRWTPRLPSARWWYGTGSPRCRPARGSSPTRIRRRSTGRR